MSLGCFAPRSALALLAVASWWSEAVARSDWRPRLDELDVVVRGEYDTNLLHEPAGPSSVGGRAELQIQIESGPRDTRFWLGYDGSASSFSNSDRYDRVGHEVELGYEHGLTDRSTLQLTGEYDSRTSTEDRRLVEQIEAGPSLEFALHPQLTLEGRAAYRSRRFREAPDLDTTGGLAGLALQWELSGVGRWILDYRYEVAEGDQDVERGYRRHGTSIGWRTRIGAGTELRLELEGRRRSYPERAVEEAGGDPRLDHTVAPSVVLVQRIGAGPQLRLGYEYQHRTSNEIDERYDAHRFEIRLTTPLMR